jgi:sialic acid synthase SpsE
MAEQTGRNVYESLKAESTRIYVIADAGLNHGGSRERALTLVRAAKWAGADAVRFEVPPRNSSGANHSNGHRGAQLSRDAFTALYKEAQRVGIDLLVTPYDEETIDSLAELGVQGFQLSPGDVVNRSLIEHIALKGRLVLLSTSGNSIEEIENAVNWIRLKSNDQIVLLHGVASGSAKPEDLNLKTVPYLRDRFGLPVGFSDPAASPLGAVVAASTGAQVIERHVMIENRSDAPDHAISMDSKQLRNHIEDLRKIGIILGQCEIETAAAPRTGSWTRGRMVNETIILEPPSVVKSEPPQKQAIAATASLNPTVRDSSV